MCHCIGCSSVPDPHMYVHVGPRNVTAQEHAAERVAASADCDHPTQQPHHQSCQASLDRGPPQSLAACQVNSADLTRAYVQVHVQHSSGKSMQRHPTHACKAVPSSAATFLTCRAQHSCVCHTPGAVDDDDATRLHYHTMQAVPAHPSGCR
jgi:hypothetical protein